jgi:hypothetical protein
MSVICIKLTSGEELIGTLISEDSDTIVIEEVSAVVMMPGQDPSQFRMGLMPFLPYSESVKFTLKKQAMVTTFEPSMEMVNNYNRKHGAGIQVVQSLNG